jgi:hypothetical protein
MDFDDDFDVDGYPIERESDIDIYEDCGLNLIWGIKSYDDLTGQSCSVYTMNDFEILQDKETGAYMLSVETVYAFTKDSGDKEYVQNILKQFKEWMEANEYPTDHNIGLWDVFTNGVNIRTKFKTIPEAYAVFKLLVSGYCA